MSSTGIHDGMTFGKGDLDHNGYWEFPCSACAREYERRFPEAAPCWPFEAPTLWERIVDRMRRRLRKAQLRSWLRSIDRLQRTARRAEMPHVEHMFDDVRTQLVSRINAL